MSQQYEPLNDTGKHSMFRLSFGKFALGVVSLPFAAFIFCIAWSVLYDFTASTSTHCGVPNYLPSISAAIGNYQPQRIVWQSAILLQALPRLLIAHQYVRHYTQIIRGSYRKLAYVACALNTFENIALIGLTLRTSSADYGNCVTIHMKLRSSPFPMMYYSFACLLFTLQKRTNSSLSCSSLLPIRICSSRIC